MQTPPSFPVPRRYPRVPTHARVRLVPPVDRAEVVNLSRGGMYLRARTPPHAGRRLHVEAWSPAGERLRAAVEVRHVQPGHGAGVMFLELDGSMESVLDRWLAEADRAERADAQAAAPLSPVEGALQFVRRVAAGHVYDALGLAPLASTDEVLAALDALEAPWAAAAGLGAAERRAVEAARGVVRSLRVEMADRVWRLRADFRRGLVMAKDRLQRAADAAEVEALRQAWCDAFPERHQRALREAEEATAHAAQGALDRAVEAGDRALADDPFNVTLRQRVDGWRHGAGPA